MRAQDNKPWVVMKEDAAECGALLSGCIGLVALLAALLEPFMPSVTRSVRPPAQHGGIKLGYLCDLRSLWSSPRPHFAACRGRAGMSSLQASWRQPAFCSACSVVCKGHSVLHARQQSSALHADMQAGNSSGILHPVSL